MLNGYKIHLKKVTLTVTETVLEEYAAGLYFARSCVVGLVFRCQHRYLTKEFFLVKVKKKKKRKES